MDKELFWDVIREVNCRVNGDDRDAVLMATQKKLMEFSAADIAVWHQIKGVYMGLACRNGLRAACAAIGSRCSDDGFIDFRSWLVSRGREVYMRALGDPDSLADVDIPEDGADFEAYGYVAVGAYAQKKEVEAEGLAAILKDYRSRIGREGKADVEGYLCTLERRNDIYKEIDARPLKEEEKEKIRAEVSPGPDIGDGWSLETLPGIVPRLCRKYGVGQGMSIC